MNQVGTPLLEARKITKEFPGVRALDEVDLVLNPSSVHCVMGENGAGKSTLVRILTGVYKADSGEVLIGGEDPTKDASLFHSVAYVPQEIDLFEEMTVAENLFMPFARAGFKGGTIRKRHLFEAATESIERFAIHAKPHQYVKELSVSNKQLLQIARAYTNTSLNTLILDEPTTSLTDQETHVLFEIVRGLRDEGKSVIFISHKLSEMFELGDYVTVLRNGKQVGHSEVREVSEAWVIDKMSGEEIDLEQKFHPQKSRGEPILRVNSLSGHGFEDISFDLNEGEILGFAGLVGSGRTEIMQTIYGFLPRYSGEVLFRGNRLHGRTFHAMEQGLVYLPEERKQYGILETLSVRHNIGIGLLQNTSRAGVVDPRKEKTLVQKVIDRYNVRTPSMEHPISSLSGGNQQKAIIGRAMFGTPRAIIFDEPTKGIDVKTKVDIYRLMQELADEQRIGIILVSSELDELLKCASRVVTIYEGKKTGEFRTGEATRSQIVGAIINAKKEDTHDESSH